jgi:hypothetical protein
MVVPVGGVNKRRQPLSSGVLHHHVQRLGMVSFSTYQISCRDRCAAWDYSKPIDLCNRLNTYIVPEAAVHGFLTFLFLINGYWIALILNLPLLAWNGKKYV